MWNPQLPAFWWPRGRAGAAAPLNVAESGSKALFGRNLSVVAFLPFLNTPLVVHLFYFSFIYFVFFVPGENGPQKYCFMVSVKPHGRGQYLFFGLGFFLFLFWVMLNAKACLERWNHSVGLRALSFLSRFEPWLQSMLTVRRAGDTQLREVCASSWERAGPDTGGACNCRARHYWKRNYQKKV